VTTETIDDELCRRINPVMELVGQRWASSILLALGRGATRFTQITAAVDGLSDRMLAKRLKELQHADLVERTIVPTTPVQVRYTLTDRGRSLLVAMQPLMRWTHAESLARAAG
jgi:DNA-binding HxlR family transcriptional regulator